jgi:hypothetical protein
MQTCGQTARNNTISEKNIKVALRGASKCSRRDKHNETDSVSTFGECADNDAMLVTLRQVLEEQFHNSYPVG